MENGAMAMTPEGDGLLDCWTRWVNTIASKQVLSVPRHDRQGTRAQLTVVPTSAVTCDDDVGCAVALAEDVVIGGHEVVERRWEGVFRDGGETVARCDDHTFGGPEQLGVELDERRVGGVSDDVAPTVDEEDDAGVREVRIRLRLGVVIAEGIKVDGDALWRSERVALKERVGLGGGRCDLDADRNIRRDVRRIWASSALVYRLGGA